jgi:hypothetical protein
MDQLDNERFTCSRCDAKNLLAIDGTWPKVDIHGNPRVTFEATEDDSGWHDDHASFVCYDCLNGA